MMKKNQYYELMSEKLTSKIKELGFDGWNGNYFENRDFFQANEFVLTYTFKAFHPLKETIIETGGITFPIKNWVECNRNNVDIHLGDAFEREKEEGMKRILEKIEICMRV